MADDKTVSNTGDFDILATIEFSKNTFSFIMDEEGREKTRQKLIEKGVTIDALEKVTAPYKITNVTIVTSEDGERSITIEVDQDLPDASGILSYNLLFLWVLKGQPKQPRKSTRAKQIGAIMSPGNRQLTITDKDFQFSLSTRRNGTAYIMPVQRDIIDQFENRHGLLVPLDNQINLNEVRKRTGAGLVDLSQADIALLRSFATAAFHHAESATRDTLEVYYPSFFRELGIDVQSHTGYGKSGDNADSDEIEKNQSKAADFMAKLNVFEDCIGVFDGGRSYWKVFDIIGIDQENQTITIAMPYFLRLFDMVKAHNLIDKPTKAQPYKLRPWYSFLIHSKIVSERNKPAVEIATLLVTRLEQRGGRPDAELKQNRKYKAPDTITYKIKFSSIVRDIPLLHDRIASAKSTSQKNQVLKRAFTGAYGLMKARTDAYQYFVDLHIPEVIPTVTTMDTYLIITHSGIDGDFESTGN